MKHNIILLTTLLVSILGLTAMYFKAYMLFVLLFTVYSIYLIYTIFKKDVDK